MASPSLATAAAGAQSLALHRFTDFIPVQAFSMAA